MDSTSELFEPGKQLVIVLPASWPGSALAFGMAIEGSRATQKEDTGLYDYGGVADCRG
jgi:hypothetical protein